MMQQGLTSRTKVPRSLVSVTPIRTPFLQRKCACGGSPGLAGECEECRKKRLIVQRREMNQNEPSEVPPIVHELSHSPEPLLNAAAEAPITGLFGHTLSGVKIQAKLMVSTPGDRYEREADFVADAVTRASKQATGPETADRAPSKETIQVRRLAYQITPLVQREVTEERKEPESEEIAQGEEPSEEKLEEMEESNVAQLAQRKAVPGADSITYGRLAPLQGAMAGRHTGHPLDAESREFMETRFGHNFSHIRIHADEQAHKAATAVHARAFTIGQNIWFARGEFCPGTTSGRHLLAHELTHTIQQRGSSGLDVARVIQRSICPSACEAPVSAGRLCRASRVTRDGCGTSDAADPSNKISHIRVVRADRKVSLFWNGTPGTESGTSEELDCTPHPSRTPAGSDTVGTKCGVNHTSWQRYNMAWFTAFQSRGMRIGFHNSQPLGSAFRSHGCVRVSCEDAEKINRNTQSGWTSILVR